MRLSSAVLFLMVLFSLNTIAQNHTEFEVITAENADKLIEVGTWDIDSFSSAGFNLDSSELAMARSHGQLEFVNLETLDLARIIDGIEIESEWLDFSSEGSELLLSRRTGEYTLVETATGEILASNLEVVEDNLWFSTTHDVRKYIHWNYEGAVSVHDTLTRSEILRVEDASHWSVDYAGELLLTGNQDRVVKIWDIETGNMIFEIQPPLDNATDDYYSAGFTPEGLVWVSHPQYHETQGSIQWYSPIQFWNISNGEIIFEVEGVEFFRSLQFDPTNTYILAWGLNPYSFSTQCRMWNTSTLSEVSCIAGGNDSTTLSPNGQLIVINNGTNPNVTIRQIGCVCPPIIRLETGSTWFVEFSPDGRFLVTIDLAIHLWAVPSNMN